MRFYFYLLFGLMIASSAFAESTPVRATARILVTKYTIGDNIRVLIETETPKDFTIEPPSEKTDISPFELKKVESSPVARGKNRVRRTFVMIATAFDKGTLTFPSVAVRWRSPNGQSGEIKTEPLDVEIVSVGKRPSDKNDIRAIKAPVSFGAGLFWTALEVILAILLSLALILKIVWRRLHRPVDDETTKPPHVRVRLELERLEDKDLAGVADALRRYVERRFAVDAMEKTTGELADAMKSKGLERAFADKVRFFLERADLIKFAKEEPTRANVEAAKHDLLAIVDDSTPRESDNHGKTT